MITILTIICVIALIIIALINAEELTDQVAKVVVLSILSTVIISLVHNISYNSGVKDGAYNQLRGKYEVTYVINKDSCVVDTIINLN